MQMGSQSFCVFWKDLPRVQRPTDGEMTLADEATVHKHCYTPLAVTRVVVPLALPARVVSGRCLCVEGDLNLGGLLLGADVGFLEANNMYIRVYEVVRKHTYLAMMESIDIEGGHAELVRLLLWLSLSCWVHYLGAEGPPAPMGAERRAPAVAGALPEVMLPWLF
jgi:hypothetical protein